MTGRTTVLHVLTWFAILAAIALVIAPLSGCATQQQEEEIWHRVCYEQPLGQAENGMIVVRHFCTRE